MPASTLFPGEKVVELKDFKRIINAQGYDYVEVDGHKRYLSLSPNPEAQEKIKKFATPFGAQTQIKLIDRSNLDAAIDDQIARKARTSDYIDFDPYDQDGLPTCWAIGMAQAFDITRRIRGLPHVQMSGCSLAVPISGGHRGGDEADSLEYSIKYGIADTDAWQENDTNRSLNNSAAVIASRLRHKTLSYVAPETDQEWWSCLLQTFTGPFAYNWMSHVMAMCDFVRIEAGRYGYRPRNSWGRWGSQNLLGQYGFNVYPLGHGTPDSGYILLDILASAA